MASFKEHVKLHLDSAFEDIKNGIMKGIVVNVQDIEYDVINYDENHIYCVDVKDNNNEVIINTQNIGVIPFIRVY